MGRVGVWLRWFCALGVTASLATACSGRDDDATSESGGGPSTVSGGSGNTLPNGAGGERDDAGGADAGPSEFVARLRTRAQKVDLLLMIDNSLSMAVKQELLGESVSQLLGRLVTPACVDANGVRQAQDADADGNCAVGAPEFPPVRDLHVGVVTSSLGGHGDARPAID